MENLQMLTQLRKELYEHSKYYPRIEVFGYKAELGVHINEIDHVRLIFSARNEKLVLLCECYKSGFGIRYDSVNHDIVIGEINVDNIIGAMDLFVNYGKVKDPNGPSMNKLWNNRYMKTKSAKI